MWIKKLDANPDLIAMISGTKVPTSQSEEDAFETQRFFK
jgi:hypothetical protein